MAVLEGFGYRGSLLEQLPQFDVTEFTHGTLSQLAANFVSPLLSRIGPDSGELTRS